jgi:integrase/recombinase XerD
MNLEKYLIMKESQGIEKNSLRTYRDVLSVLNTWKALERLTKEDLIEYFNRKEFKEKKDSTKNLRKIVIKAYFTDCEKSDVVDWIKIKSLKETLSPEQTLNADDINELLKKADNHYDKALIAFLYDSGCRISEAQRIKWKDLQDTTDGIITHIPTKKTNAGYRKVILPFASQYLRNLQIYSYGKPDDFIFPLSYRSHADRIQKLREKSGIQKPFTCHKLRHAQATQLVKDGVQEGIIRKKMGWSPTSAMISRYTHPNDDSVIEATLKAQGKRKEITKPIEIVQPEKLSITDAAGHLFKLEEENASLQQQLKEQQAANEKRDAEFEEMKRKMDAYFKLVEAKK